MSGCDDSFRNGEQSSLIRRRAVVVERTKETSIKMKKFMTIMLGLSLLTGAVAIAGDDKGEDKKEKKAKKAKKKAEDKKS
jgi:nitrate reductase gamma subunit